MKREAAFNTLFNKWLKNVYKKTGAFELKQTQTNSLPFNAVVDHQEQALMNAKWGVLVYKIPDAGYQNPFDCFVLSGVPAYVVIKYPNVVCVIDIDMFSTEKALSQRRSLTSEKAVELAEFTIKL